MIVAHERKHGFRYDVVVNARLDPVGVTSCPLVKRLKRPTLASTLFTAQVPPSLYASVMSYPKGLALPAWGSYGGYNDRFLLGRRDVALDVMQRLSGVCDL